MKTNLTIISMFIFAITVVILIVAVISAIDKNPLIAGAYEENRTNSRLNLPQKPSKAIVSAPEKKSISNDSSAGTVKNQTKNPVSSTVTKTPSNSGSSSNSSSSSLGSDSSGDNKQSPLLSSIEDLIKNLFKPVKPKI